MPSTGIPIIDNVLKLALVIIESGLIVMFGGRLLAMLHKHQYGRLAATVLVFGFAIWFTVSPQSLVHLISGLFSGVQTKIDTGGAGGAGTGG
jgi:hypothetical protein